MDDRLVFTKGMLTVRDWKAAFGYDNALQVYFFLISYLPLKSGIRLPSYPLPIFGEQTGQFRFLLAWMVLFHAMLLVLWAWFAAKVTSNRLASLLSLLLFTTSPTLMLWTPQPDSRLVGLPFILVGLRILLGMNIISRHLLQLRACLFLLAGSLFGIAQSVHYTSLYLVVPVCITFWMLHLWRQWRQPGPWFQLVSFVIGCLWLHGLIEYLSYFHVGIPWGQGPTMTLLRLRDHHASHWSIYGNLQAWAEWFLNQMGLPLIAVIIIGWLFCSFRVGAFCEVRREDWMIVGVSVPLGVVYLCLSGAMPFFRQTSVLQPFLFLFGSIGIVNLANRLATRRYQQAALVFAIFVIAGITPWGQSIAVFQAHQSLGRALDWAHVNKGDRELEWLPIAWFGSGKELASTEDLEGAPADALVISYFPWSFFGNRPTFRAYAEAAQSVAVWPSLYATDAMWAELKGFGHNDFRYDPILRDVRIYQASSLIEARKGSDLRIKKVDADSVFDASTEPVNVFDRDNSPDNVTFWRSADTPMPHFLEVRFEKVERISTMQIVLPPADRSASRISALEIQVEDEQDAWHTVWAGYELERYPVITPRWNEIAISGIRMIIRRQAYPHGETNQAMVEEIVFPGYQVVPPMPQRRFSDLILREVHLAADGIVVSASNVTSHTVLVVNGNRVRTRRGEEADHLRAIMPEYLRGVTGTYEVHLTDGFRKSNSLRVEVKPPVLRQLHPASTRVNTSFNVQPDGNSALSIESERAEPGTVVMFDSTPLATAFGDERWLTAIVPRELIGKPGRHVVWLRNPFGESNRLDFTVVE